MLKLTNIISKQTRHTQRLVILAAVGFIFLGVIAYASIPDANGVIHGCYKKTGGTLRVVDGPTVQCAANEVALSWNQAGQQGQPGPEGPQGPQGPAGSQEGPAGGALDGMYPNPGIADGAVTTTEIKDQTISMNDLAPGSVSAPKMIGGAAATNIWGNNQWAPANATQRGYVHVSRDIVTFSFSDKDYIGGFGSISYPVPLGPSEHLTSHVILAGPLGDADPPAGCGGSLQEPMAEPGYICIFYRPVSDGAKVIDVTSTFVNRYGRLLRVDNTDGEVHAVSADVVWAMTPPIG